MAHGTDQRPRPAHGRALQAPARCLCSASTTLRGRALSVPAPQRHKLRPREHRALAWGPRLEGAGARVLAGQAPQPGSGAPRAAGAEPGVTVSNVRVTGWSPVVGGTAGEASEATGTRALHPESTGRGQRPWGRGTVRDRVAAARSPRAGRRGGGGGRTAGRPGMALTPPTAPGSRESPGKPHVRGRPGTAASARPRWRRRGHPARPPSPGRAGGDLPREVLRALALELLLRAPSGSTRPASRLGRPGPRGRCGSLSTAPVLLALCPPPSSVTGTPSALCFSPLPVPSFALFTVPD